MASTRTDKNKRFDQEFLESPDPQKQALKNEFGNVDFSNIVLNDPMGKVRKEASQEATKPTSVEVFRDQKGNLSGVTSREGKTYLGLSPNEVRQFVDQQNKKYATPEGAIEVGQARAQEDLIRRNIALTGQVGQINPAMLQNIQANPIDYGEALTTGVTGAIPRALSYGTGIGVATALGGTAVGGPAGTIIGGAAGFAAGFVGGIASGIISNMKKQRTDTISGQKETLTEGKTNLQDWVTLAKMNPAQRQEALNQFNTQLILIERAYGQMKIDSQNDVLKFNTAKDDLAEFEAFYSVGGERERLISEMQMALLNPVDPNLEFQNLLNKYNDQK